MGFIEEGRYNTVEHANKGDYDHDLSISTDDEKTCGKYDELAISGAL